jgi:hypothetical protein
LQHLLQLQFGRLGEIDLRLFLVLAALLAAGHSLFAATFVLKSGKKIEGKLLYEDREMIRLRDNSGTNMSIRKSLLDQDATRAENARVVPVAVQIAPDVRETPRPKLAVKTYSNVGSSGVRQNRLTTSNNSGQQLRETRRELDRLTQACRSAGGGSSRGGVLRTVTYMVHGKPVRITGYWANPSDIENAKRLCKRAIQAEQNWLSARQNWEDSQRASTSSASTTAK